MDHFDTTATCLYQTQGTITRENIRSRIVDYQIADVKLHPDIPLPAVGFRPVSIKIAGVWYEAVASVAITLAEANAKTVKIYIRNFEQQLQACNVLISWDDYLNTSKKQKQQDEPLPVALSL